MPEYFFELLTEEIPAWMHDAATATLRERLTDLCATVGATNRPISVQSTSRRIAFVLPDLPERTSDQTKVVKGPPKSAAYKDGQPAAALNGFLKKQNVTLEQIIEGDDPQYVWVQTTVPGVDTTKILEQHVPQIVEGLRWPKMMRWGKGEHSYIRPVHSVISIFDGAHLPIAIFGTASGTETVGHRTLAPRPFHVKSYNEYVSKLELARVYVDPERRRHAMAAAAIALSKEVGGKPSDDASIWFQWQFLTEYPGLVRAEFRPDYLALPEEVLVMVMRVHQKQLPIRGADGRLSNAFLAVLDNDGDPDGNAAYGNSFVTNARFADAKFFYETDRRKKLEERIEQLSHLQFQEKLGNYARKTERIARIVEQLSDDPHALEAARLCKSDLVTEMVKEFTELQGVVGGIYAREEGYPEPVWQAIYDHYLPASLDDPLPRGVAGALVSLADRIDTLAGFFSIGIKPTGSKDPFGLRRAAQGIVQILLNRDTREIKVGIDELIDLAIGAYGLPVTLPLTSGAPPTIKSDLLNFFFERVRTILEGSVVWNFAYDEVAAGMHTEWWHSLTDLVDRIQAVKSMRNEPNFLSLLDSVKRIVNITGDDDWTIVDPAKLEHPTEKRLNERTDAVITRMHELTNQREYRAALEAFAEMAPDLEQFFKDVMVNVDDPAVRINRMALLRKAGGAARRIADVTKIVVDRRDYRAS